MNEKEQLYQRIWRPLCAFTYIIIILFDFIVFPIYKEINKDISGYSEKVQIEMVKKEEYTPMTLKGGGMFHLAMGALLTGAAVTRGLEKKALIER